MMNKKKSRFKKIILFISIAISIVFFSLLSLCTIFYHKYDLNIDKLTSLNNGIKVYSSSGNDSTLYNTNRSIVDINELPNHVKNAFIAVEDKGFYKHKGYDLKRIVKASLVNFSTKSKTQGASTISQQLIKNALLSNEKTYSRKVKEIVLSIKMEKQFNKEQILEMYLNTIYFGSNAYGIENASKIYFNKSAKDLSLNEACCLAGIIKSPAFYSPNINYNNSIERKNFVAKQMLKNKLINNSQYNEIINSSIVLSQEQESDNSYEKEAIFEACNLLNLNERDLINAKYEIITFKQDKLQSKVIEINNQIIDYNQKETDSTLDSLSILTNNSGHVLAYYANSKFNLHNLKRQPASTLKPLAVYLPCFIYNILSPASQILDEEINYSGFAPQNADKKYHGYVSTRNALSQSLNVPAVKALDYLGVKKSKETLSNLGINISNSDLNLSLSLGAIKNGLNLMDLLTAYTTLANQGDYITPSFVKKIKDENGNIIYEHENYFNKVVDEGSCFLVNDILKDCATTGTASRLASLNIPIASKTGTASNEKGNTDLYNIAYTTEHTMLTWIADIDKKILPKSMKSSSQPTDINRLICEYLYQKQKPKDFDKPNNIIKSAYDLIELENTTLIAKPNHDIERFKDYDYFKQDNLPIEIKDNFQVNLNVNMDKMGATITFNAKKCCLYNIFKKTSKGMILLDSVREKQGLICIKDNDVFNYNLVEYLITDQNENILDAISVKPKEFLITLLNNEIFSNKKKWLV